MLKYFKLSFIDNFTEKNMDGLNVKNLVKIYGKDNNKVTALNDVSFCIPTENL